MITHRKFFNKFTCNRNEVSVEGIRNCNEITARMIISILRDYFIRIPAVVCDSFDNIPCRFSFIIRI